MKIHLSLRLMYAAFAVLAWLPVASATQVTYYGIDEPRGTLTNSTQARNNFVGSLASFGTETFESYASFTNSPNLSFTGSSVTATTMTGIVAPAAGFTVSGTKALVDQGPAAATGADVPDIFNLSTPVNAFGGYFSDAGDGTNVNTLSILLENTSLGTSVTVPMGTFGPGLSLTNVFYFGVVDTNAFDRVTLLQSMDYDGVIIDDLTVGSVPEPGGLLMAGSGFALLGASLYRKRRRG